MHKKIFSIFILTLVSIFVVSSSVRAQQFKLKLLKRFYSIGTAGINGIYYPLGGAIARVLNANIDNIEVISEPTKGSVANVEYLKEKQIDLALVQSDVAFQAFTGTGIFKGRPFNELRALASLYPEVLHVVVLANSSIHSLQDLKGKTISLGSEGSGSALTSKAVLKSLGMASGSYNLVYERFTKGTEALKDGYVDALMYIGGVPTSGITLLSEKCKIRLISIPKQVCSKILSELPYLSSEIIPADTYSGVTTKTAALALRAMLVTTDSLSNKMAFAILKTLFANTSKIVKMSGTKVKIHLKDSLKGTSEEMLHAGARRYYIQHSLLKAPKTSSPTTK